jgi:hypothetical protein
LKSYITIIIITITRTIQSRKGTSNYSYLCVVFMYDNQSKYRLHTKVLIPSIFHRKTQTLWPNYVLTQFLTNHGCFRSYLYKRTRASAPLCSCPQMEEQTALHLLKDCSLFNEVRPATFQTLTLPQIMQHQINTKAVSSLINDIYRMLQQQSLSDQP